MTTAVVVRLDSAGDVLLAGPAIRAVAAHTDRVALLCGPQGEAAARLLVGVDEVIVWPCPWVVADPSPVDAADIADVVRRIAAVGAQTGIIFTSFHQSPLPTALLLRLAGVPRIAAISEDYPGALLDVRHAPPGEAVHEVERMLSLAAAAGFAPGAGDDGRLVVRRPLPDVSAITGQGPFVVVHPGASVPARAWSPEKNTALVQQLSRTRRVLVTGGRSERALTAFVAGDSATDLGGALSLAELAAVLQRAAAVVVGNTGPAHLAAAVGTPVVSLFAPVVPAERWRPYGVPAVVLGDQGAPCAGTRARWCPVPGHPCLDSLSVETVVEAVDDLAPQPASMAQLEVAG
ncbi:MAG: glycosyl transferase family 9 [Frankiales bacterium]|nr:glycosyl transferase family 9 [Frankiales bacterium]